MAKVVVDMNEFSEDAQKTLKSYTKREEDKLFPIVVTPPANFPNAKQLKKHAGLTSGMCIGALVSFMKDDPDMAWSWCSALSMAYREEGAEQWQSNRAAARFISVLSNGEIDMAKNPFFIQAMKSYDEQVAKRNAELGIEEAKATMPGGINDVSELEIEDFSPPGHVEVQSTAQRTSVLPTSPAGLFKE